MSTSESTKLTREQAEAALEVIKKQYAIYVEGVDGYEPLCPLPVLVEDWADVVGWQIVWEEGPEDWAYRAFVGGTNEEIYQLMIDEGVESGKAATLSRDPVTAKPEGIFTEPYNSFVLSLYPEV